MENFNKEQETRVKNQLIILKLKNIITEIKIQWMSLTENLTAE